MAPKPFIETLILKIFNIDIKNRVIVTHHIDILILEISNLQTISNLRVSNSKLNQR